MFELVPMTKRVQEMRERYRTTVPKLCTARFRIITDFYEQHPELTGSLRRALMLKTILEEIPVSVFENELIVGTQATTYRGSSLNPEFGGIHWFKDEWEAGTLLNRATDQYLIDQEDIDYVLSKVDFWDHANNSAKLSQYIPEGYKEVAGNGVTFFRGDRICINPIGHFSINYKKMLKRGLRSMWEEARENMRNLEGHQFGQDMSKYIFYRSVALVLEGMMCFVRRYGEKCAELAAAEGDAARKAELEAMSAGLFNISEKPASTFWEAVQLLYLYHIGMCLDGQQHGISFGRVDQYFGSYYDANIAKGILTPEQGQEILDLFYLKCAEMNKMGPSTAARGVSGYTSGMLMTMGGVDENGNDATNAVTYMMLQSSGRLLLHDPPQALRIHKGTPKALWDAALSVTMRAGGVPTFESDEAIIPALRKRGMSLTSARNYCLIGCVEPAGCGDHWSMAGCSGWEGYWNMANCYLQAINNGINPFPNPDGTPNTKRTGLPTGYLYEMEDFDQVLTAVRKQMKFFVDWQISMTNLQQILTANELPLPLVSAATDGCMESGKDVMDGGALNNSTGFTGIAVGNLVDCLAITKYMVYDKKLCTARELYDAFMDNWVGHEDLRDFIMHKVPRYGNGDEYCDRFLRWITDNFSELVHQGTDPRGGKYHVGMWPVAFNVLFGLTTAATPDGRRTGEPLADGISPMQGVDTNGPTALLSSIAENMDQTQYPDGTLLNLKLHPTAFSNEGGFEKVQALMRSYFARGGMELQLNVISSDALRKAQKTPEEYQDLVVRVAGFSAYFVELTKTSQNDIISRTELTL